MAKTFDPNRVRPGTIELVRDSDGNYTTKVVGFETINSLSLPDISTTAAVTQTDTDTKTATDITGDTIASQTQSAFKVADRGDDNQVDTTGNMLQEAKKTSDMLSDTFTRPNIRDVAGDRITSPLDIQSPTETVFDRPIMRDVAGDRRMSAEEAAPQENILSDVSLKDPSVTSANVQRGEVEPPGINFDFLKGDRFKQGKSFTDAATRQAMTTDEAMRGDAMTRQEMVEGATADDATANTLGITKPADTITGVKGPPSKISKDQVLPEVKPSALETVSTSLKSAFKNLKTPAMMLLDMVGKPRGESAGAVAHNKQYFTDRGDGRIGGNPTTDLYAGMNRVSMFGNLSKAGDKRIEKREETIEKKGYKVGDKFYDDTQKMKDQSNDYKESLKEAPVTGTTKPGTSGGSEATGSKIVCTMMNEAYGFGAFRNKIWMKFHGNIAPEYQKGYHKLFLPLVNYAKQKGITNKIIKNILEHIAVHSTIDMRQTLRGKKHTLGRLYRKVILPLCYWIGKK
jgi:hypothetical protein